MAPRTSWKGFLKLSLVSVPVKAYTANNTSEEVRLNQLHAECHSRVKYKKVCPEHGELASDQIVSGYEYSKDQYVVIDAQDLAKLRPESDKSVRISGFVPDDAIDPVYMAGKTYYLLPDGVAGNKPYTLLARGMQDAGVCAVAHVTLSGREQLVKVRPVDDLLVMSILNVSRKVKPRAEFAVLLPEAEATEEELSLTSTLIDATLIDDFDFTSFKDSHTEALSKLIQLKVDGQEIVQAPDPEEPKIINLMDALKKSVADAQGAAGPAATPKKKASGKKKVAASRKSAPKKTAAKKTASRKKLAPSTGKKTARRKKSG